MSKKENKLNKKASIRVNTLLIGAGRSGTTSLCSALAQHPEICFSTIKEVNYFSIEDLYSRGEEYFHSFFDYKDENVVATSDTYLLPAYDAIEKIHSYNPEMKLVVLLRDPVNRAYSSYNYSVNYGHHKAYHSFLDSIDIEKDIMQKKDLIEINNLGHFYGSLYARHLQEWAKLFPKQQMLILRTSDMRDNPGRFSSKLTDFLGIQSYQFTYEKQNVNAIPRSRLMERMLIDRNSILRKAVRKLLPWGIKQRIIKSGKVEQIHNANRQAREATVLSDEEYNVAKQYFVKDLEMLQKEFGIIF